MTAPARASYALSFPVRLDLDSSPALRKTHPDLIRKLVVLGALDAQTDSTGRMWFAPAQVGVDGQD